MLNNAGNDKTLFRPTVVSIVHHREQRWQYGECCQPVRQLEITAHLCVNLWV